MIKSNFKDTTTLPLSLQFLIEKLNMRSDYSPEEIVELIQDSELNEEDLTEWEAYDHPINENYGRRLIYLGDHYEIMAMSWNPGDFSAIHDHGNATYGGVKVFGPMEHAEFKLEKNHIITVSRNQLLSNTIHKVDSNLIHQIGNPTSKKILTFHIYGINKKTDEITADTAIYNVEKGQIEILDGGAFFDLSGQIPQKLIPGLTAGLTTQLGYLARYIRYLKRNGQEVKHLLPRFNNLEDEIKSLKESGEIDFKLLCQELEYVAELLEELGESSDHIHEYLAQLEA